MNLFDWFLSIFLNPWFLMSLFFWLIIFGLWFLLRHKKENFYVFFPMLALLKTKKLNEFIKKLAKKSPKFWKTFFNIGFFVSFCFTIFAYYFFFINLVALITNPKIENAVTPLIPGVTIDIPIFMYLILPILFVMTTHELAHGIAASIDNVDVKSTGLLGVGFFYLIGFGAFVEVDERELYSEKHHRNTRLRIAAAGTYVNAITAGVAFLLLLSFTTLISPFYGAQVTQVDTVLKEEQGGFNYGKLDKGDVITAVKIKGSNKDYVNLDADKGISLTDVLLNDSDEIKVRVGQKLTLNIYDPTEDSYSEKDVVLGPRYNIGIYYEYTSNDELTISRVYSKEEGGNNYNKNLKENTVITKINGHEIDVNDGKTLEKVLTTDNLTKIKLTSDSGKNYYLDVELEGVVIGILTTVYWMPTNAVSKFFTGNFPGFLLRELLWLWIIAFSITLFNMLPLPIFDGDRIVKELINSRVGSDFKEKKIKKDKLLFKKEEKIYTLIEYRVEKILSVKFVIKDKLEPGTQKEVILGESNYSLIDKFGSGYKDSISFNLPQSSTISDNSIIEISYEYWHDAKKQKKKNILNAIRLVTLVIVGGNFIISLMKFGTATFWI